MISCSNHSDREATGMCVDCGKPFCAECLVEVDGKMHCKSCVATQIHNHSVSVDVSNIRPKSKSVTLLLCFFLGWFGIHRFYLGKVGRGFIHLLLGVILLPTLYFTIIVPVAFFAVWVADIIMILKNWVTDVYGRPLV